MATWTTVSRRDLGARARQAGGPVYITTVVEAARPVLGWAAVISLSGNDFEADRASLNAELEAVELDLLAFAREGGTTTASASGAAGNDVAGKDSAGINVAAMVASASDRIFRRNAARPAFKPIACILAASVHGSKLTIAYVGDGQVLRLRGQTLARMNRPHTLGELAAAGQLPEEVREAAKAAPGLLVHAAGVAEQTQIDTLEVEAEAGDVYLLTDLGLTFTLDQEAIASTLREAVAQGAEALASERLLALARATGYLYDLAAACMMFGAARGR